MTKYGGHSYKDRKKHLCDSTGIIIKERFTGKEKDYLKIDIINTILKLNLYNNNQKKYIKKYSKHILFKTLENNYFKYIDNIDKIIFIQKYIKVYLESKLNLLRGPGYLNYELCKNSEDFLYMIDINKSDKQYFYSYSDSKGYIWYFDIRSINRLLNTNKPNPYNREEFPKKVNKDVIMIINKLKARGIQTNIEEYEYKDLKEKVKRKLIDLCVNITQSGYGFNSQWLETLNKKNLIHLYRLLEDMWNYRVDMTIEEKKIIIPPTGIVFNYPLGNMLKLKIEEILDILINDINKFENSIDEGNKKLGYIYLIACLSVINPECIDSNTWVQWL